MRNFLLALSILFLQDVNALPPSFDWISHQTIGALSGGRFNADFTLLNKQMELWGFTKPFDNYYYTVGYTACEQTLHNNWDGTTSFEFILPHEIKTGGNDSLIFRMKGWHFTTSLWGKDLIPGDAIALTIAPGIDWGNITLKRIVQNNSGKYKNPFVAPLGKVDLRFVFWKIAFGARAVYRYDITYEIWKRKTDLLPVLPGSKMSGLGFQVFIGWGSINY